MGKLRIALILDNKDREYNYLLLLKKILTKKLQAEISLIGSVAELQRIYYLLYKIKPHMVFLSQIVEKSVRDISLYVKQSGGLVFVLPAEITVIPVISFVLVNNNLKYDKYVDSIFIPGERMMKLYRNTDVSTEKLYLVGSPKMDVLISNFGEGFQKRSIFLNEHNINTSRKNIFIFTSFITLPPEFFTINNSFKADQKKFLENNNYTLKNKAQYINSLRKLVSDFPLFNIILKVHPLEQLKDYKGINAPNFYILPKVSLYNCLNSIDLAIHWSSTVATECWIKGITTLQYIPFVKKKSLSEFMMGNPIIKSYDELVRSIKIYMGKKTDKKFISSQQKFIKDNYYLVDGKSCLRIADIILKNFASKQIQVNYSPIFSKLIIFVTILQKIFGLKVSRRIMGLLLKKFDPEYSIKNFVEEVR